MDDLYQDRREELGAPLLLPKTAPGGGPAGSVQMSTVRKRRLWFDAVFGVLFGAFVLAIVLLALTVGVKAIANRRTPAIIMYDPDDFPVNGTDPTGAGTRHNTYEGVKVLTGLVTVCGLGLALSAIWMQIMVWCAPTLLSYTLIAVCLLGLGVMSAFFAGANAWAGVITLIVTLTAILYFQQLKRRMAFASANIKVACSAIWDSPPIILVGLGLLVCQVLWGLLWALAVYGAATNADVTTIKGPKGLTYSMTQCATYETPGPNVNFTSICTSPGNICMKCVCAGETVWEGSSCFSYRLYAGWLIVLLFGFLWGCAVIRNLGHCTVSGTVGTWWVSGGERSSASVGGHMKRAVTTSFGSICLGSMLVALVQTIRQVLLAAHRANQRTARSNTVTAMLSCLLVLIDRALSWFNKYALVYVALYGLDFMSGGAATTELFKARGVSALVNDTLIEAIMNLGAAIVGLFCAVVGYLYGRSVGLSRPSLAVLGVAGAFIGAALALVVAAVVESAVCTIFVCFAEDPQSLEISHPELSDDLVQAWEDVLQGPLSGMRMNLNSNLNRGGQEATVPSPVYQSQYTSLASKFDGSSSRTSNDGYESPPSPTMKGQERSSALDVMEEEGREGGERGGGERGPEVTGMEEGKVEGEGMEGEGGGAPAE